jgi:hypothetical protein
MHQLGRAVQAPKLDAPVLGEEIKKLSRKVAAIN